MNSSGVRLLASAVLTAAGLITSEPSAGRAEGKRAKTPQAGSFPVSVVAFEDLIRKPANLFDLEGKTLRFLPQEGGSWKVETTAPARLEACATTLPAARGGMFGGHGWRVELPFAFPFAGKAWRALYVNNNGNISFEKSEAEYLRERSPWSDGGMRSMAAAIDSRSAAGQEQMIAALWAVYDLRRTRVSIRKAEDRLIATWRATREAGNMPVAGANVFQARLHKSGVIEFAYAKVPERDGIVGLFTGHAVKGERVHQWTPKGKAPHPSVDLVAATIEEAGSVLRCTLTLKEAIPPRVDTGKLEYRCFLKHGQEADVLGVGVTGARQGGAALRVAPRAAGYRVEGRRIDLYYSRILLAGARQFHVAWDAVWWGHEGRFVNSLNEFLPVQLKGKAGGEIHLSAVKGTRPGNVFEVFHYPLVTRNSEMVLRRIYQKCPANDDLALVLTDFRLDDLFGEGDSSGALNQPIKGIGKSAEKPRSTEGIGSKRLQVAIATNWVGAPKFAPTGRIDDREWLNFGRGVIWLAHEWGHRWGMGLRFRDPKTGRDEGLADRFGHWRTGLHAPPWIPVADRYAPRAPLAHSIMDGAAWRENADGTFSKSGHHLRFPGGLSALDLYAMGVIPAEQVPDTFLLRDLKDLGGNRYQATRVTVRIEDVIAAMGPREPPSSRERKEYCLGVYLVHEPGREANARMVSRAGRLSAAVADFFHRATGGRMRLRPPDQSTLRTNR
jgi:hypothetical protein